MGKMLLKLLPVLLLAGCATSSKYDREYISKKLFERSGYNANRPDDPGKQNIPQGVQLADGLDLDEAIRIALYNNKQFQADLMDLAIAHADQIDAGQLPNPMLNIIFPTGTDVLKGTLNLSADFLFQRPYRVKTA